MEKFEILEKLKEKGELGEYIGEGNDREVYNHAKNKNLVIKVPKTDQGLFANKHEASNYIEEESMRIRLGKEYFPDGLARCAMNKELGVLYMQKLIVTKGSDFGVTHNGVIRKFDLNLFN